MPRFWFLKALRRVRQMRGRLPAPRDKSVYSGQTRGDGFPFE